MCETGTGQQVAQFLDSYMMMIIIMTMMMIMIDRLCGLVVSVEDYKHRGPGHSLGFF
jgi:hypothetical protein